MLRIRTYTRTALAIILGERCVVCGRVHAGATVCPECLLRLPYLDIHGKHDRYVEQLLWGYMPLERASSLIHYTSERSQALLESIKYRGRSDLALQLGRMMGEEFSRRQFFEGIDCIQPVPLHPARLRQRGYNQSERLAQGIAQVTGLPVVDLIRRRVDNVSQTKLGPSERRKNVEHIFVPNTPEIHRRQPQHILFVDDVITTGATLINCVQAIVGTPEERFARFEALRNAAEESDFRAELPDTTPLRSEPKVSVLSLAFAGKLIAGPLTPEELHHPLLTISNVPYRKRQMPPWPI